MDRTVGRSSKMGEIQFVSSRDFSSSPLSYKLQYLEALVTIKFPFI